MRATSTSSPSGDLAAKRGQRRCCPSAPSWSRTSPSWMTRRNAPMFLDGPGHRKIRSGPAHPVQLRPAGPHLLPDLRQGRVPRLDHQKGHQGSPGRRQDPLRHRAGLHSGRDHQLRRDDGLRRQRGRRQGKGPAALRGQGVRGQGRRHDLLPLQRITISACHAGPAPPVLLFSRFFKQLYACRGAPRFSSAETRQKP